MAYTLLGWLWDGHGMLESVLAGIALTMAILPEEIPVILTVFLALGAWRISKHKVPTRRVPAVEALGTISVLAVDKTGTLTRNRMQMAELGLADEVFRDAGAHDLPEPFHELVEFAMLATPADPFDPMEKAIQNFGLHWLTDTEHVHAEWLPKAEYGLSPDILAMTRVFRGEARAQHLPATRGAPEAVIELLYGSFASIVATIRRGRRIYDNITKATRFVFAVHIPIIALALVPALLYWLVLLMPVHIVLLELLIDPACSIVFEAEPEADDIMNRPPCARTSTPFVRANLERGVIQGLGSANTLLCGYGVMLGRGASTVQARTGAFIALVTGLFLLVLANRSLSRPLPARIGNPWLARMPGGVAVMLIVVIGVPFFRDVMALALPEVVALGWAAAMLLVTVGWLEGWRRFARRIGTRRAALNRDTR